MTETASLVINTVAVLLSPLIAVLVTVYVQDRRERRRQSQDRKLWIFNSLIATRHSPITEETVRALNMIDVAFSDSPGVRRLWHEYFDMLCNQGLQNELGVTQRQKKNLEMLTEMANTVGYGKAINHLDVSRVYLPVGLQGQSMRATQIADELLRVLRASGALAILPQGRDSERSAEAASATNGLTADGSTR